MEKEIIAYKDPKSPISEIFRTLRTNLQFMNTDKGLKSLLVTSSMPGEGKSWISSNLAITFAQESKKVLIIDADMRKGRMHSIFNLKKSQGLSNYLANLDDDNDVENYIKSTQIDNLFVMTSGDIPPNPSELLMSERMKELLEILNNKFDMIIFDGTPCLLVTDSTVLARYVDTTLIVTSYKTTKMSDVEKVKASIEKVGGKIAGIVINQIPISPKKYEQTYYYGNHDKNTNKLETENKDAQENKEITDIEKQVLEEVDNIINNKTEGE